MALSIGKTNPPAGRDCPRRVYIHCAESSPVLTILSNPSAAARSSFGLVSRWVFRAEREAVSVPSPTFPVSASLDRVGFGGQGQNRAAEHSEQAGHVGPPGAWGEECSDRW